MPKKVRSAKGEIIDWDRLTVKNQMAATTPPTTVKQRQDFIDKKLRRRVNTVKSDIAKAKSAKMIEASKPVEPVEEPKATTTTKPKRSIKRNTQKTQD